MEYIKGPDFPTAGIIMGRSGIRAAYATGRGKITLRPMMMPAVGKSGPLMYSIRPGRSMSGSSI